MEVATGGEDGEPGVGEVGPGDSAEDSSESVGVVLGAISSDREVDPGHLGRDGFDAGGGGGTAAFVALRVTAASEEEEAGPEALEEVAAGEAVAVQVGGAGLEEGVGALEAKGGEELGGHFG